jgi:hypothetical protein
MFDHSPIASGRSPGSLVLSLVIHGLAVTTIFLAGYTVAPAPRREAHVQLLSPVLWHAAKPSMIRAPKRFTAPLFARLRLPSLAPPLIAPWQPPAISATPMAIAAGPIPASAAEAPAPPETCRLARGADRCFFEHDAPYRGNSRHHGAGTDWRLRDGIHNIRLGDSSSASLLHWFWRRRCGHHRGDKTIGFPVWLW